MVYETIQAFLFIIMAEMGDKTQMLAMAFATKYSLGKVLLGVFIGAALNHGLAALLGTYLTNVIPIHTIKLLAALAFIGFGLWSLKIEDNEEEETRSSRFGPILTVASAFFMGEIGDKTQLTVITLASQANYPLFILLGTVGGMIVTSAMGVFIGSMLGKKVPEVALKIASASVFILFGLLGLKETVPQELMTIPSISIFLVILTTIVLWMINNIRKRSSLEDTPYKKAASELYLNTKRVQEALARVYQSNKECAGCSEEECTIRWLNRYLQEAQKREKFITEEEWHIPLCKGISCNPDKLKESLIETINTCMECTVHQKNCVGNQTRKTLEILYFGKSIPYRGNSKKYYAQIKKIDPQFFQLD
ncbi:Putative Ca2+/H+ antiporter, TMEM165/GDT1 family [Anaerovirgula multivorans]|uniref:GDT1 family protein n=1 Tax=Anaerovirgula multivorans TaxID=312168 RepID=A0A239D6L7_9FIRM|nr:TMEM165/GDT1 family protein [Anaerovirgula multivorans]SNS27802.1 Putative Ca2+/H+ antiporter, TMEM165/GDT1 family [Anaerovirgula multivorans]